MAHESEITYHEPCSQGRGRSCARAAFAGGCDAAGSRRRRSIVAGEASLRAASPRSPPPEPESRAPAVGVGRDGERRPAGDLHGDGREHRPPNRPERGLPRPAAGAGDARLDEPEPGELQWRQRLVTCNLGSLARGASATITIVVTANRPGWMTDYAWVSTNPPGGWEHRHSVSTNVQGVSSNVDLRLTRVARQRRHRAAGDLHGDRLQLGERRGRKRRVPGSAAGQGDPRLGEREPGELQRQSDDRAATSGR